MVEQNFQKIKIVKRRKKNLFKDTGQHPKNPPRIV